MYIAARHDLDRSLLGAPQILAIVMSLLIHSLFMLGVHVPKAPAPEKLIKVSLVPQTALTEMSRRASGQLRPAPSSAAQPPVQIPKQIVSPSEAPEKVPEKETKYLSDKNTSTDHEQVKRGDPQLPSGPKQAENKPQSETKPQPETKPQAAPQAKAAPAMPPPKAAAERGASAKPAALASLHLNTNDVLNTLKSVDTSDTPEKGAEEGSGLKASDRERAQKLQNYQPFAHGSSVPVFGMGGGVNDYLPNLPDGDITLLNAKADQYAIFVRRVALQVFGALRRMNWASIPYSEVTKIRQFSTIQAVMTKEGKLVSVELMESSGSSHFDDIVVNAAKTGGWDQNPPSGAAAEDGKIHFVFKSQTWARPGAPPVGEQRWILLGTGLL